MFLMGKSTINGDLMGFHWISWDFISYQWGKSMDFQGIFHGIY
jgi:hypothetical protein